MIHMDGLKMYLRVKPTGLMMDWMWGKQRGLCITPGLSDLSEVTGLVWVSHNFNPDDASALTRFVTQESLPREHQAVF